MSRALVPLLAGSLVLVSACFAAEPSFPPPPRLATTPAELAADMAAPGFAETKAKAIAVANVLLSKPVTLPDGPGGWMFDYACRDDGTPLKPLNLQDHQCPKCGKVYSDEKMQESYRCVLHGAAERASLALGWGYVYTGDEKYVAEVKRILLKLAHDYPGYPGRHDRNGLVGQLAKLGGRRYTQSLDEAVGIISLAKAYDLTRNSPSWTAEEKTLVERDLFGLTAQTLLEMNIDISNHQTWYNAGLMAIADVLGDGELVKKVLSMKGGVYDQLQRSVTADGLWYEGAQAYHNYALNALISTADTTRRLGVPISGDPKFKSLFTGPLHATYPNGDFPVINDSDPINIHSMDSAFLWAWKTYKEPMFARAYAEGKPERLVELLGPDAKPESGLSTKTENLKEAGLVFLRQGSGADAVCAVLDYGPHGGGHGHFDKLNLMLYANGREWLLDPGRLTYSHKEYKTWVKQTIAHNTVTLDGESQKAATGSLGLMVGKDVYSSCFAETDQAYPGSKLQRYLRLEGKVLLDTFEVTAPAGTQVDWAVHSVVAAAKPVSGVGEGKAAEVGTKNGYQHLTGGTSWTPAANSCWEMVEDADKPASRRLRMWFLSGAGETVFTATGIGYRINQKAQCVVRRRVSDGSPMKFVTVYDLSGDGSYVKSAEWKDIGRGPKGQAAVINGDTQIPVDVLLPIRAGFDLDVKGGVYDPAGEGTVKYAREGANIGF